MVDENGNFTGEVLDRETVHKRNLFHWEVAVFIINHKNQILLQKRSPNKKLNPNKWSICAGHVDSGEKLDDAAIREVEEEIGLKLSKEDLHIIEDKRFCRRDVNSHVSRMYYAISDETNFKLQKEEVSDVKWVDLDELIERINNNDETLTLHYTVLQIIEELKNK